MGTIIVLMSKQPLCKNVIIFSVWWKLDVWKMLSIWTSGDLLYQSSVWHFFFLKRSSKQRHSCSKEKKQWTKKTAQEMVLSKQTSTTGLVNNHYLTKRYAGQSCNEYHPFEGLDVCLKGLAEGISRMFSLSLELNWARGSKIILVWAWLIFHFKIDIYPFIRFSSSTRLRRHERRHGSVRKADVKLLLSSAHAQAQGLRLRTGGKTSRRFALITTPTDTDGHGQSRRSNPLDGTQWVSYEPSHGHIGQ